MDRRSIERRDFPIERRGYDPAAVDAHLRLIADRLEELEAAARGRSETLADAAGEQVRGIVEAAESSAAEIRRRAEQEAGEQLARVSEAVAAMLQRLEAVERELASLFASLQAAGRRLGGELEQLAEGLSPLRQGSSPTACVASADAHQHASEPTPSPDRAPEPAAEPPAPTGEPSGSRQRAASGAVRRDAEGARLVALNMVLNGTPREEVDRYLAENFALGDRQGLLDEVYAAAGDA